MGYQKQLWGVLHYLVLPVLWVVTVEHIECGRLHIAEYIFPDVPILVMFNPACYTGRAIQIY
jgi:hypothetical protein